MFYSPVLTTIPESARPGEDFNSITRTLTFPANVATITEELENLIIDDTVPEDDETFRIQITEIGSVSGEEGIVLHITIHDDDGKYCRSIASEYYSFHRNLKGKINNDYKHFQINQQQ